MLPAGSEKSLHGLCHGRHSAAINIGLETLAFKLFGDLFLTSCPHLPKPVEFPFEKRQRVGNCGDARRVRFGNDTDIRVHGVIAQQLEKISRLETLIHGILDQFRKGVIKITSPEVFHYLFS